MQSNLTNPIIPHPPLSLERSEMKMQSFINSLARKMIKDHARTEEKKKTYYIHLDQLIII